MRRGNLNQIMINVTKPRSKRNKKMKRAITLSQSNMTRSRSIAMRNLMNMMSNLDDNTRGQSVPVLPVPCAHLLFSAIDLFEPLVYQFEYDPTAFESI